MGKASLPVDGIQKSEGFPRPVKLWLCLAGDVPWDWWGILPGDQEISPWLNHIYLNTFLLYIAPGSDSVEGMLIFRQCHRPTEQGFLGSSLNESITSVKFHHKTVALPGIKWTELLWLHQRNVKNKGLERTFGHHQQHLQWDKTFILNESKGSPPHSTEQGIIYTIPLGISHKRQHEGLWSPLFSLA